MELDLTEFWEELRRKSPRSTRERPSPALMRVDKSHLLGAQRWRGAQRGLAKCLDGCRLSRPHLCGRTGEHLTVALGSLRVSRASSREEELDSEWGKQEQSGTHGPLCGCPCRPYQPAQCDGCRSVSASQTSHKVVLWQPQL